MTRRPSFAIRRSTTSDPYRSPFTQLGNALALDGTGNVYVAGSDDASGTQKLAVWKLLATNGTLDASFGTAGQYTHTGTPGADSGNAIAIDSAGRLVVAGSQFNGTDDDGE